ncbi:MAG: phage protein Gp36 family protein [Candidatus Kapaibacterium sp.]
MSYSTIEDLLEEFSDAELARISGDPDGAVIDTIRVKHAIEAADAVIDSYLSGSYDVPFSGEINPIIRKISLDLTVGNLYDYHHKNSMVPSTIIYRKLNAFKLLKEMQKGNLRLAGTAPGTDAPPLILSNKETTERIFTNDLLDQFSK